MLPGRCEGRPRGRETRVCHQTNKDKWMEVTGKKKNEQKAHGSSQGSDLPSLHIFGGPRKAVTFLCQVGGAPDHLQAGDSLGFPWWLGEAKT